jgi:hypothetical protein
MEEITGPRGARDQSCVGDFFNSHACLRQLLLPRPDHATASFQAYLSASLVPWSTGKLPRRRFGINLNPMIAHARPGFRPLSVKQNEVCFLSWHVAINAVLSDGISQRRKPATTGRHMATQTALGERGQISLRCVHIMACGASHSGGLEAAAFLQKFDLTTVNIHLNVWRRGW